jgi:signal transduction histidine kinase/DNA-binding response OmpR family regulator/ligand-binding sensor domain-containing protein
LSPVVRSIAAAIFVLLSQFCLCQIQKPLHHNHDKFGSNDGLPNSYISAIAQDHDGFMWFSTPGGLARYDGREFLTFTAERKDSSRLSFNNVHDFTIDRNNMLWLVYFNGHVDKMNPRTFEIARGILTVADPDTLSTPFSRFNDFSRDWTVDDSGNNFFYSYSDKLKVYDTAQLRLARAYHERGKHIDIIYGFTEDNDRRLWLLTKNGFEVASYPWVSFRKINYPVTIDFNADSCLYRGIVNLSNNQLLTAATDQLLIFSKTSETFTSVKLPGLPRKNNDPIRIMIKDNQGRAIIAWQGHVFRLEENGTIVPLWQCPESGFAVISSLYKDTSNTLWVGTNGYGLYKIDLNTPGIEAYSYKQNFLCDLLTNELGISLTDIPATLKERRAKQYWIRYYYDTNGNLFLVNNEAVKNDARFVFRVSGKKLIALTADVERKIVGLRGSRQGDLWALSDQGELYHWANSTGKPTFDQIDRFANDPNNSGVFDLEIDDQYQWVSTKSGGLYQLKNGEVIEFFPPTNDDSGVGKFELTDVVNDPADDNILWIGTLGGGLIRWDKSLKKVTRRLTEHDGLANNNVNGIIHDREGNIWISTNAGISSYNPVEKRFSVYTMKDGLFEDELQRFVHFLLPDGRIAFGGLNGYTILDPRLLNRSPAATHIPALGFTRLYVNNATIENNSGNSILARPLNEIEELTLTYDQNSIGLNVAALEYNHPERNLYRHKLDGYDNDWINAGNNNAIRYNKLAPGAYTLHVMASNAAGVWNTEARMIRINVRPPFWMTWWAYSIYAVIFLLSIRYYLIFYKNKINKQQQFVFNQREAIRLKELDEMKTRFFSNITHEFRTPLTLILSPLQKHLNDDRPTHERATTLLQNNYRHASQLLKLVNQLLDLSKLEAGRMVKTNSAGDLNEFTKQCVELFRIEAVEKNVQLTYCGLERECFSLFDESKLEKIIFNLLGNATKFTATGSIHVALQMIHDRPDHADMMLQVRDTGIGISPSRLPRIFDRFYQVDSSSTRTYQGTGIGLALVKELTDLIDGKISVESTEGHGTTFMIEFPIEKIQPDAVNPQHHQLPDEVGEQMKHAPLSDHTPVMLVVEDNAELRAFVADSLSAHWKVIQACDGNEAWEQIRNVLPDIVVSDVMMPGMNGFELCKKSKRTPLTSHINFLLLTAKAAHESKVEGLESGADDYITKPFHPYELELRIRNLLLQQERLRQHLATELLSPGREHIPATIHDEFLSKLYDILSKNIDNTELDVETIAQAMAVSKSTLNRKLKAVLNISIPDLVKQFRLQKSVELIKSGYRMSEIAYAVGFESPSYFARCFKEHYQKTPTEFASHFASR